MIDRFKKSIIDRFSEAPPPRPPPPMESRLPHRPPLPVETDDEEEMRAFWERVPLPKANQPILVLIDLLIYLFFREI